MDLEIAVVGGGVSGAYSAWRLQEAQGVSDRIALFEYSNRIGGRLFLTTVVIRPTTQAGVEGSSLYLEAFHSTCLLVGCGSPK
jgi:monoamine oxidase